MIKKSIPNFITCLNLSCGVLAILSNDLTLGVYLIILGGIFDVFDGLVARALNASSSIGMELDSLADIVSFGVAPAVLYYKAFAVEGQFIYLLGPLIIASAGAVRLARFNASGSESTYFEGLAIPASGIMLCGLVYGRDLLPFLSSSIVIYLLVIFILAYLNISKIKMFSFKQFGMTKVKVYFGIIAIIGVLAIIFLPVLFLATVIITYIVIAVINSFFTATNIDI